MIKSMTGFGRAEQLFEAYKISVEIKSVNNRYLDINTKVYKQYSFLEEVVRECVSAGLSRGKVDVFVQIEPVGEEEIAVTLNDGVVKGYRDALSRLVEVADVPDDIAASSFLRLPDVFKIEKQFFSINNNILRITAELFNVVKNIIFTVFEANKIELAVRKIFQKFKPTLC